MRIRIVAVLVALALPCVPAMAQGPQGGRVYQLGYLALTPPGPQTAPIWDARSSCDFARGVGIPRRCFAQPILGADASDSPSDEL